GHDHPKALLKKCLPKWRRDYFSNSKSVQDGVQTSPPVSALSDIPHPIHNLPVEILQRIFTCSAEPRQPDQDPFLKLEPEWISITHVCRFWRAVALNHHFLWGTLTPNLSSIWLRTFMIRSEPAPVDADLRVGQNTTKPKCLSVDEVIDLLFECTRRLCRLDMLRTPTSVHSLTLSLWERGPPVLLPDELFGGQAPIRRIHFTANRCIVAPPWLLRGVTHFTSGEQIPLLDLLDALRQMSALTNFTLQHCRAHWEESDAPLDPPIQMPCLTNVIVHADSPRFFAMLNRRLALPPKSKRQLVLHALAISGWDRWARWFAFLLPFIKTANGLQHVYLTGGAKEGIFRAWTGDAATAAYEDAEFSFEIYWYGSPTMKDSHLMNVSSPILLLDELCDLLGATKHGRRLILEGDLAKSELPESWCEVLEIHPNVGKALYSAWKVSDPPVVLPALRQVQFMQNEAASASSIADVSTYVEPFKRRLISRIVPSKLARPNSPTRTIGWAPSCSGFCDADPSVDQLPSMYAEPTSEGLIRLLHGGGIRRGQA
ncbi:hypothetical protein BGW80DRAFT_1322180, partial [Lactifluus volemus]